MNKLISVIVPVYNVKEEYLTKCLDSIINQKYQNLEIIIVDDGSNESIAQFLDINAKKDSRIKLFHRTNHGVSSSRNYGIEHSTGDYITFVDSDDYIDSEMYYDMIKQIKNSKVDIIATGILYETEDNLIFANTSTEFCNQMIFEDKENLIKNIFYGCFGAVIWNKLYNRKLLIENNIKFDENIHSCEDLLFLYNCMNNSNLVLYINKSYYHYVKRNESVTNSKLNLKILTYSKAYEKILSDTKKYCNELNNLIYSRYALNACTVVFKLIDSKYDKKIINDNYQIIISTKKYWKNVRELSKRDKIIINLMSINPYVATRIWKLYKYLKRKNYEVSMKKIGIITISDNNNYGNRLQNYALQKFLERYCYVDTLWNNKDYSLKYIIKEKIKIFMDKRKMSRFYKFKKFTKKIIHSKFILHQSKKIKKIEKYYDYMITGSDQVWNPYFNFMSDIELLSFVSSKKRISYAASFGVDRIDEFAEKKVKEYISNYKSISVREDRGKEIIEELTGRKDVQVLVDPTMLLTPEEWDKVSNRPKQLDKINEEKYILNYFLGELSESRKNEIEKIATENNCHIINILDKKDPFYVSGPSEFLYLEKHAFLICTDSFHSSVFAILYNRPFVVFDREQNGVENMNSRIDTLIDKFKLENRRYNGKSITKENLEHDYTEAYIILEKERKKSKDFLEKALDIKK